MGNRGTLGSRARTLTLAATIALLTAATFRDPAVVDAVYVPRYAAAFILAFLTWTQGAQVRRSLKSVPPAARLFMRGSWALALLSLASTTWSVAPSETLQQAATFLLLVATMHVHVTRRWCEGGTIAADVRTIFWTLAALLAASLVSRADEGGRLAGLHDNPNALAFVALTVAALGVGVYADRRRLRVLLVVLAAVAALAMTESRTALLALGAGLLWVALSRRRLPVAVVMAATGVSSIVLFMLIFVGRVPLPAVADRFTDDTGDMFNSRTQAWDYALYLWHQEPLTGYGYRAGAVVFDQNRQFTTFIYDEAHSSYLQLVLELGWLGILVGGVTLLGVLSAAKRASVTGASAGLVVLVVAGLGVGFTESALMGVGQVFCWAFWLAAAAAACSPRGRYLATQPVLPDPVSLTYSEVPAPPSVRW